MLLLLPLLPLLPLLLLLLPLLPHPESGEQHVKERQHLHHPESGESACTTNAEAHARAPQS